MDAHDIAHYRTFGFVVLRQAFDPTPLAEEVERALREAAPGAFATPVGAGGRYVPMMVAGTPTSLDLLDRLSAPAAALLGRPVVPLRAKAVHYFGEARWHRDSEHRVDSIGLAAYLEPLHAANGALRLLPGSHRAPLAAAVADLAASAARVGDLPGCAAETAPGDVIAFDEHLFHASAGGRDRRQWRVDFVADPATRAEEDRVRAYLADTFPPGWDGGYDVDRFPTYGPDWRAHGRPAWVARLAELGAYDLAGAEEAYARSRRPA